MLGDWMKNFDPPIPAMLQAGIHVMIYAGTEDFICNWVGNQRWVDSLPWFGKGQWAAAEDQEWMFDGKTAGTVKSVGPLSFVKVDKAGHMVGFCRRCLHTLVHCLHCSFCTIQLDYVTCQLRQQELMSTCRGPTVSTANHVKTLPMPRLHCHLRQLGTCQPAMLTGCSYICCIITYQGYCLAW